ncbi:hypothetical protein PBY51_020752 [Eleginops maclovinus]|uniref:Uncharacterized protein n=1 Tax=Eleginops maclovinus TaxID=56733 RepID=A0AAN7XTZ9_ELEMC|nr:hypothetical protein PBY51_020752 [Eleginops maclovinus]
MDPIDWDAIRAIQKHLHPNNQNHINNSNAPRTNEWDTYCEYSRNTDGEAHSSMRVNVELERLSPSSHNFYIEDLEVQDPDGEPLPMGEEDPELSRKRKELREIEERIMFKKAAIALKAVEPTLPNLSSNAATCKGATLKDRVNDILQQRDPARFNSRVWSRRERMHSSTLIKDILLQNNHPLKLRVKALMKSRCSDPARREGGEIPPPSPSRSFTSPAKEENIVNEGFQRFLSVLNKGVDIDFLSRIVNDDVEDLPSSERLLHTQPPAVEKESQSPFMIQGQQSSSEASLPGFSQTNRDHETLSIPGDEERKNDRRDSRFDSSIQSKSPVIVVKEEEEEDKPKVDVQHEQLQDILKTLGLNLKVEEMSQLEDQTQERLYGKKIKDTSVESSGAHESQESGPQRCFSNAPSSPSSSKSNKSRSLSPSPPLRQCSPSRNPEQKSEQSYSRERSRDRSRDNRRDRIIVGSRDRSRDNRKDRIIVGCRDRIIDGSRDRSREWCRDRSRDRIRDRSRDNSRDRSREWFIDRSRERIRHRSRDRSRERIRDRSRDRSRERIRDRSRDRSRERIRDRSRDRSRERIRDRSRDRSRERIRDRSRDRSRERIKDRDSPTRKYDNQDRNESYRAKNNNQKDSLGISTHHQPQNQTNPCPYTTHLSTFTEYSVSQHSQHTAYDRGTYNDAANSYWGHMLVAVPPSLYPGEGPYPLNPYQPGSFGGPHNGYPNHNCFVNPDLSISEGQAASFTGKRCLQVINSTQPCVVKKKKTSKQKWKVKRAAERKKTEYLESIIEIQKQMLEKQRFAGVPKAEAEVDPPPLRPKLQEIKIKPVPKPEPTHEEKRQPTEKEVKANLRKTLEAFNQKVKQRVPQPANFPTPHTDY